MVGLRVMLVLGATQGFSGMASMYDAANARYKTG